MAFNLLPLLLVGGAAAYVVTSEKKKREEVCPPTTTVTLGELSSVSTRATEKFGQDDDPSKEASFLVNELLPSGCSRASKDSTFKISIPEVDKSWELSIPDTYMLLFASGISVRVESSKLTEAQAKQLWTRELDWYKKLTGKNFDPSESAMELAKLVGEALFGKAGGGNPSKDLVPEDSCPGNLIYDIDEAELIKLTEAEARGRQLSPNDPFKIADVVFAMVAPPTCTKKDFNTTVTVNVAIGSGPQGSRTTDLAALYAMFVLDAAESINLGPAQMAAVESKVASNYQQLTGKPLAL
jgi:hypothetical protein